jgi:hypothetical protein
MMICPPARTDFRCGLGDGQMYLEPGGAGGRRVRLPLRAAGVLRGSGISQDRKITLAPMRYSGVQADLVGVFVDRAAARGRDSAPGPDLPSDGRAERPGKVLPKNTCPISVGMQLNSKKVGV